MDLDNFPVDLATGQHRGESSLGLGQRQASAAKSQSASRDSRSRRSIIRNYRNTLIGTVTGLVIGLLIGLIPLVGEIIRTPAIAICMIIGILLGFRDDRFERRLRLIVYEALIDVERHKSR